MLGIMVVKGASHLSCNFKNCLWCENYTKWTYFIHEWGEKTTICKGKPKELNSNMISTKNPFILDISKKITNNDFPKEYICMIQNYKE
jgi:hypothetical protein